MGGFMSGFDIGSRSVRVIALVVIAGVAFCARADEKIGFIDSGRVRTELPDFQEAQAKYERDLTVWQEQMDALRADLDSLQDEYASNRLLYSEQTRAEMEQKIEDARVEYEAYVAQILGPGGKAEQRNAELTGPIYERLDIALATIAADGGYTFIVDIVGGAVAYAPPDRDLTDRLLDELSRGR
jgi:outer membrane protein